MDVEGGPEFLAGNDDVVVGRLVAGRGIDLAAGILDLAGDGAGGASPRALEEHVLDAMCPPHQVAAFVVRSDMHPEIERDHRRRVVLAHQDREAVRQNPFLDIHQCCGQLASGARGDEGGRTRNIRVEVIPA
ncbi:MAG: hypothetical protein FD129_3118 [bacterium]|nr:MAG: hypothetical protein FD129_3118 [bacterium]